MGAWVVAQNGGMTPHLFTDPHLLVHLKAAARPPHPPQNRPGAFSLKEHGAHFDVVVAHGPPKNWLKAESHVEHGPHLQEVQRAGPWVIYRVSESR
jgi:hypothetical protein